MKRSRYEETGIDLVLKSKLDLSHISGTAVGFLSFWNSNVLDRFQIDIGPSNVVGKDKSFSQISCALV